MDSDPVEDIELETFAVPSEDASAAGRASADSRPVQERIASRDATSEEDNASLEEPPASCTSAVYREAGSSSSDRESSCSPRAVNWAEAFVEPAALIAEPVRVAVRNSPVVLQIVGVNSSCVQTDCRSASGCCEARSWES